MVRGRSAKRELLSARGRDDTAVTDDKVVTTKRVDRVTEAATNEDVITTTGINVISTAKGCGRKARNQVNVGGVGIGTRAASRSART